MLSIAGLLAWCFADALFGGGMFVFRDAAHYYYPLLKLVADQWAAGRVPLWNPYENLGMPLAADPTASVFYPGKLIFALPLGYAWTYKLYIMAHLLLAAAAAYRLARHWQASVIAAGVCAISYAFSGNVLVNYCNVVYLVGAAWMPLALLAADRMLRERSLRWAAALGMVLALMVLGGDPQAAYHAGLLAAMYAAWLWWCDPSRRSVLALFRRRSRLWLLAAAAATGLILSAVQVLPSLEFTRNSGRMAPRGAEQWLGQFQPGTHQEHIYHFSVGPWRLAEYVWPNVSGRQFPIHRRWLEVIPAEGRIWTPSLYMGIIPLLMALAAMRLRRGEALDRWLSWSVVLAVLGSFGWFGLGWLAQEVRQAAGGVPGDPSFSGAPLGGLYWLMTMLLPGYASFRYPAKLLAVAAIGLSVLAARGWDRTFENPANGFRRGLAWLGGLSVGLAVVAVAIRPYWAGWLAGVKPDMLFGPLDTGGAANDLLGALLQTAVVCGLFWWLLRRAAAGARWTAAAGLILVAVDLAVANRWLVACAPAGQWTEPSTLAVVLQSAESQNAEAKGRGEPYRVYRRPLWMPAQWKQADSPTRLAEAMRWDRDTLWPKYHLPYRISLTEVEGAMMPYDYQRFLESDGDGQLQPFSLAKYVILRGDEILPGGRCMLRSGTPGEGLGIGDWGLESPITRSDTPSPPTPLPQAGEGSHVASSALSPQNARSKTLIPNPQSLIPNPQSLIPNPQSPIPYPADVSLWYNPAHRPRAWIEHGGKMSAESGESCRVVSYESARVEIEAVLTRPGQVILCDQFYPGWLLDVETAGQAGRAVPIVQAHRVMRGAELPAGRHRLVYRYRPASLIWGGLGSGLGWLAILLWAMWRTWRRGRGRVGRSPTTNHAILDCKT